LTIVNVVKAKNAQSFGLRIITGVGVFASFHWRSVARYVGFTNKWLCACAVLWFALSPLTSHAQDIGLAVEAPQVRALLKEAMVLERSVNDPAKIRRAASLYCKASRLGSTEAQYRLGLLYLAGKGVPKNRDFASVLFSQAAQQGHARALDMLEGMRLRTLKLPPCLV
jgi:TPR repeat protein